MLSGAPPFTGDEVAMLGGHLNVPAPPLTSRQPRLPRAVDAVFARALAKDPAGRYPSCREFSDALRGALSAAPTRSIPPRPGRPVEDAVGHAADRARRRRRDDELRDAQLVGPGQRPHARRNVDNIEFCDYGQYGTGYATDEQITIQVRVTKAHADGQAWTATAWQGTVTMLSHYNQINPNLSCPRYTVEADVSSASG